MSLAYIYDPAKQQTIIFDGITAITASTTSTSSQERVTVGPADRISITEGTITVHTEPISDGAGAGGG